jgi:hypothetical protein
MNTYTLLHVIISLVGIVSGLVVLGGLLVGRDFAGWTGCFLSTTLATSLTGFGFPFEKLLPSHVFGVISVVALAIAFFARNRRRCVGGWRTVYICSALFALYLNMFVAIVQAFLKIPGLYALAPTQAEWPFLLSQALLFFAFILFARAAVRFRSGALNTAR